MSSTATITRVSITPVEDGFTVAPIWAGVDRSDVGGWQVANMRLARRLEAAILAGVVCTDPQVCTDVNGKTYVSSSSRVRGRAMNADLKRLGF